MKKLYLFLLLNVLGCMSFAQNSEIQGVDLDSAVKILNELYSTGKDLSKLEDLSRELMCSTDENINMVAYSAISLTGNSEERDRLEKLLIDRFPNGYLARQLEFDKLIQDSILTANQYALRINDFYRRFAKRYFSPLKEAEKFGFNPLSFYDWSYLEVSKRFIENENFEFAIEYVLRTDSVSKKLENYSFVAQRLLNLGENSKALTLSEDAYDILNNKNVLNVDAAIVKRVNHIYLKSLIKTDRASQAISLAHTLYTGGDRTLFIIKYLLTSYQDKMAYREALNIIEDNVIHNHYPVEDLITANEFKELYANGGDSIPFAAYLSDLLLRADNNQIGYLKDQLINVKAKDFSLLNLENRLVSLSDFQGKVIILDFWATWCTPCIRSFPGMEALIKKYKDDDAVVFLFINTSQNEPDYKEVVSDFINENNYSFNVLFDEMNDWNKRIATRYDVEALPTKIIIDKNGYIRFHSSGTSSSIDDIMDDLSTRIEIVKTL